MSADDALPDARAVTEVALELFGLRHDGPRPLPLTDIPRALGVSADALFRAYGWARGLWETVDSVVLVDVAAALEQVAPGDETGDVLGVVRRVAAELGGLADARPDLATYLRYAFADRRPVAAQVLQHTGSTVAALLARSGGAPPSGTRLQELATLALAPVLLAVTEQSADGATAQAEPDAPGSFVLRVGGVETHAGATYLAGSLIAGEITGIPSELHVDNRRAELSLTCSGYSFRGRGIWLTVAGASAEELGTAVGRLAHGRCPPRPLLRPARLELSAVPGAAFPLGRPAGGRLFVDELPLSERLHDDLAAFQRAVDVCDGETLPHELDRAGAALLVRLREELGPPRWTVTSARYDREGAAEP